jgi:serpin B
MKKPNIIRNAAICSILTVSLLCGCADASSTNSAGNSEHQENKETQMTTEENKENVPDKATINTDFNRTLIDFVNNAGFADQNYMVSPTSFRAALALAVAGADTETKAELIHAMGFNDMDEVNAWYSSVTEIISDFDSDLSDRKANFKEEKKWLPDDAQEPDGALIMLNSIWNNTDRNGRFGKDYLKYVKENYSAEANDVTSKNITDKVNKWVNDGTKGLIPYISDDLSYANAVLVNTLYLKSSWINCFEDYCTSSGTFTTLGGEKVQKDFMKQQERFRYYEDGNGKLVVLPLNGGIDAIFVLGDITDIQSVLAKANYEEVIVQLPKFDVETSLSEQELIHYLNEQGARLAFTPDADFSVMCPDTSWLISDIIQKTRIKVDESGLEAAAATAIIAVEGAIFEEFKPKEFIADEPFKFYICAGDNDSEMLFCGQIVE